MSRDMNEGLYPITGKRYENISKATDELLLLLGLGALRNDSTESVKNRFQIYDKFCKRVDEVLRNAYELSATPEQAGRTARDLIYNSGEFSDIRQSVLPLIRVECASGDEDIQDALFELYFETCGNGVNLEEARSVFTYNMSDAGSAFAGRWFRDLEEKELTAKKRKQLPDKVFAGPDRSYPVHDKRHAIAAVAYAKKNFRYGDPEAKKKAKAAWSQIQKAAKKYNVDAGSLAKSEDN